MRIFECVPNFSEGRNQSVIDSICRAMDAIEGVTILDVDPGQATNRTVVTMAGEGAALAEAAFQGIRVASELIDMREHNGEHPRMGATDVVPFVPLEGATMDDCVILSRELGSRVGTELGIPVYLYGHAADPFRQLTDVRSGEYEGLGDRSDPPDYGPRNNPLTGATAIGARPFLLAYNINLNTRDRRLANRIAGRLRASGTPRRDAEGAIIRDADGVALRQPGRFEHVQGVGWYIEEYGRAQVSLNITDIDRAPLHEVYEAAVSEAAAIGAMVTGSELVGLAPKLPLLTAGDHFLAKMGKTTGVPESERIHTAVLSLGLGELKPFDPRAKVIEYRMAGREPVELASFLDALSTDSPAPGGGSVAALSGSLSAALTAMVAALTHSKSADPDMWNEIGSEAQGLKDWFATAVDRDAEAFASVLAARRLPSKTQEQRTARIKAMSIANLAATQVPFETLEQSVTALRLVERAAEDAAEFALSDIGVATFCALTAAEGAYLNILANLGGLETGDRSRFEKLAPGLLTEARLLGSQTGLGVHERMKP